MATIRTKDDIIKEAKEKHNNLTSNDWDGALSGWGCPLTSHRADCDDFENKRDEEDYEYCPDIDCCECENFRDERLYIPEQDQKELAAGLVGCEQEDPHEDDKIIRYVDECCIIKLDRFITWKKLCRAYRATH